MRQVQLKMLGMVCSIISLHQLLLLYVLIVEELSSDEDHIDEEALKYMKNLKKKHQVSRGINYRVG